DIYIIPVRMESCEVPERLQEFQRLDLFERDGCKRLIEAIRIGIERRRRTSMKGGLPSPGKTNLWRVAGIGMKKFVNSIVSSSYLLTSGGTSYSYIDLDSLLAEPETIKFLIKKMVSIIRLASKPLGGVDRLVFIRRDSGPLGAIGLLGILAEKTNLGSVIVRPSSQIHQLAITPSGVLNSDTRVVIGSLNGGDVGSKTTSQLSAICHGLEQRASNTRLYS
ncbi:MAG: hypothetical protein ABSB22_11385, partial [Thermodesulfobacteriota bacterium]